MSIAPLLTRSSEPIPGYSLRERIGAGGYGEVWAAEAPGGLTKAIKFVYGQMDEARAAREFKSLSLIKGVRHPFLLSLERIEVIDGHLMIVSELADESLKERFEKCVKTGMIGIPRPELLDHLRDAADALDYMNSQHGLQHLDVKPENLLLVGGRIKVADFGLVKDIQDVTASLMGGLTPIYAPPEVFDARPSRRSDQYSLAIVYQEMLTGQLPFPGRTSAQLAAQHLTAKPRLTSLPVADQGVIEKALAKEPEQRFSSCREMVNALVQASVVQQHQSNVSFENGAQSTRATAMFEGPPPTELAAYPVGLEPAPTPQDMLYRAESADQAATYFAEGQYEAAEQVAESAVSGSAAPMLPPLPLVDLPPLEVDLSKSQIRPTLLVGVGGLAGKTLQQLRRKLLDGCTTEQRRNFSFLLADTDSREMTEATHGEKGAAFKPEETLALPIRKSADYRNDSRKYLDWLSRRWLYNIPRSQQTEGIRPFGRLAFVDHGDDVMKSLRGAVGRLLASAKANPDAAVVPRVLVVGSSSGGTSSGMITDVAFAIRQILDEQKCQGTMDLLLLHGTGRQPAAQELAAVNSYALLTELHQQLRPGGMYPGEISCGLKSRPASEPAIRGVYLVHLGQDLGIEQFLTGCKRVAEYLFLDVATPAGSYLEACRSAQQPGDQPDLSLRTFGICQIGFSEAVVSRGIEALGQAVAQRWFGEPKTPVAGSLSARIAEASLTAPASAANAKDIELESLAAGQVAALGLELDPLVERLYLLTAEELGGNSDFVFQRIIQECPVRPNVPPPVEKWFAGSARFFGARGSDCEAGVQSPLQAALMKRMTEVVATQGEKLREWLLALTENPSARVFGGQWCAKWFRTHLKTMSEKAAEIRVQIGGQLGSLEAKLALAAKTPVRATTKENPETLFLQHCQLRMYQLASLATAQFAQSLLSHVALASDQLLEFGRDLKHLAGMFSVAEMERPGILDAAALGRLEKDLERAADQLDQHFQAEIFATAGFRVALLEGKQRHELVSLLRQLARMSVIGTLTKINLMAIVKELGIPAASGKSHLGTLIAGAQPRLQQVGGQRRLLCAVSQSPDAPTLSPAEVSTLVGSTYFEQLPAVIPAAKCQVVFCYELGSVPLPHAAAQIINNRPHYAQAAARLHARTDISWQELPF